MTDMTSLWLGDSGAEYKFFVYERHPDVPSRPGIFIYAKKNDEDLWVPIYVGHGDLSVRGTNDSELLARIDAKGATHVHLRLNSLEIARQGEVADILKRYQNAFEPDGCHVRETA